MSVPATEAVTAGMYVPATPATQNTGDKDMFLQLMVAQLRYQDPMNPADSSEFLSQNAQFTALEKMQDVADQTAALLAAQVAFGATGLVGKQVTWLDDDGNAVPGTVQSVTYGPTGPVLDVDGTDVTLAQIQTVGTPSGTPDDDTSSGTTA